MQILKTWLAIFGALAIGYLLLDGHRLRGQIEARDAEIVRLKSAPLAGTPVVPFRPPPVAAQSSTPVSPPVARSCSAADLDAMTADRDRYKAGLDRCVGEANKLAAHQGTTLQVFLPPVASQPESSSKGPQVSSGLTEPTVTPFGDALLVSGKLFNLGPVDGTVTAVVTLLRDGRPSASGRVRVTVPAQGQAPWSYRFPWHSEAGAWTASVKVE